MPLQIALSQDKLKTIYHEISAYYSNVDRRRK